MDLQNNRVEISLRLLQNGKYVWAITTNFPVDNGGGATDFLVDIDRQLRDKFPDHVTKTYGRVGLMDE